MSKKAQYSDYVVLRESGEVFKLKYPLAWEKCDTVLVVSRYRKELAFPKNNLIRVPNEFTAYIKSDNCCHFLDGSMQALLLDEIESEKSFHDLKEEFGVWFKAGSFWIPLDDIELATPTPCIPPVEIDDFIIPPMPSLEELQKCSIHYEGRKTIITYYDGFVGEAICHRDDEFNVESGIALAYSRAKEAKDEYDAKQEEEKKKKVRVGDIVKVVDAGTNFSTNYTKVLEICQKIGDMGACARYAYGDLLQKSDERNSVFKVLYVDDVYAYIEDMYCEGRCRLIRTKGIAKPSAIEMSIIDGDDWEEDDWDWLL